MVLSEGCNFFFLLTHEKTDDLRPEGDHVQLVEGNVEEGHEAVEALEEHSLHHKSRVPLPHGPGVGGRGIAVVPWGERERGFLTLYLWFSRSVHLLATPLYSWLTIFTTIEWPRVGTNQR